MVTIVGMCTECGNFLNTMDCMRLLKQPIIDMLADQKIAEIDKVVGIKIINTKSAIVYLKNPRLGHSVNSVTIDISNLELILPSCENFEASFISSSIEFCKNAFNYTDNHAMECAMIVDETLFLVWISDSDITKYDWGYAKLTKYLHIDR